MPLTTINQHQAAATIFALSFQIIARVHALDNNQPTPGGSKQLCSLRSGDSPHPHNSAACAAPDPQPAGAHWQAPPPGPHVPPAGGLQVPVQLPAGSSHERGGCCAPTQCHTGGAGAAGEPAFREKATLLDAACRDRAALLGWAFREKAMLLIWACRDMAALLGWSLPDKAALLKWAFRDKATLLEWALQPGCAGLLIVHLLVSAAVANSYTRNVLFVHHVHSLLDLDMN